MTLFIINRKKKSENGKSQGFITVNIILNIIQKNFCNYFWIYNYLRKKKKIKIKIKFRALNTIQLQYKNFINCAFRI